MHFQYQKLAQQIIQSIKNHELLVGHKLKSLRDFAALHHVSISTAQRCYDLLEAQGYLYVKPKSGYFIKDINQLDLEHTSGHGNSLASKKSNHARLPEHPDFESIPRDVSNVILQNEIQHASIQNHVIPLGALQLSPPLVPIIPLRRSIQRALKHCQPEDFLYCNKQGHIKLRQALAQHWREDGIYISSDDIYISNGCLPTLQLLIQQLSQEGDSVLIPTPTFNVQLLLLANLKRKIIEIPSDHQGIDLQRLEQAMSEHKAKLCLLTANYQNPLGYCLSDADKQRIAQLAAKYQCIILEDDIYAECGHGNQRPLPIKYWDNDGYVIWISSVSKSLSSAYRVGWFCLGKQLKQHIPHLLSHNVGVNTPLQLGLADFLNSRAYRQHLSQLAVKLKQHVKEYRQAILKAFAPLNIGLSQPQGAYALWLELPKQIDSTQLYLAAQQQGISIVPGTVFGEDERYKHYIRINAGHALSPEIQQSIEFLANWVKVQIA